jgi:hypothetical protein
MHSARTPVSDAVPPELAGKGRRVAGVFVFMMGASIILDTHALWMGLPTLAVGAVLFAWGMANGRTVEPFAAAQPSTTTEAQS